MMNAVSYKFYDGQNNSTKCFPARSLLCRRREGATHWLAAFRNVEEQKRRTLERGIKETNRQCEKRWGVGAPCVNTLNGAFLLQLHCVDEPSELCSINISDQKLSSVKSEDLTEFDNVALVDASINSLSLGSFSSLGSLRELNLSLNGLCNLKFDAADFPHLQVLDLSYNSLSAEDVVSVGQLSHLKVLHLTGNRLHHLPPDLSSSNCDASQLLDGRDTRFRALEVLTLDDNKLSSGIFNSLRNLKRLKHLNLEGNCISEVPYLRTEGCSTEGRAEADGLAFSVNNLHPDQDFSVLSQDNCQLRGAHSPLPELHFLILSNNKIVEEEALLAVSLFPKLQEIDIRSNPLTSKRSGNLPLLTHYLKERLGIKIKHKNIPAMGKGPLRVSADWLWKVEERSKEPVLRKELCPAVNQLEEFQDENNEAEMAQVNTEPLFVTQAADIPEREFGPQTDEKETSQSKESYNDETVYKMLTDAKANPAVVERVGIQTAVRLLEYRLKNLSVCRDLHPKPDSIRTPNRERQTQMKTLPPLMPVKERVDKMIKEIKESTTIKESSLSSVIHNTRVNKEEYEEARRLLKDLKMKHARVLKRTTEQAVSMESDGKTSTGREGRPPGQMISFTNLS